MYFNWEGLIYLLSLINRNNKWHILSLEGLIFLFYYYDMWNIHWILSIKLTQKEFYSGQLSILKLFYNEYILIQAYFIFT